MLTMETNADEVMLKALNMLDAKRPRSLQVEIGVSALGSCARKVWYQLNGYPETNPTDQLEAMMGTAIHKMIEEALTDYSFGAYEIEQEVEYNGLKGHIDWWRPERLEICDWKTMKLKNVGYFPKNGQRWQVHTYGYLKSKAHDIKVKQVSLVALMRDGNSKQIRKHSEPYDEAIALQAIEWLEVIKQATKAPAPEMDANQFCKTYCPFFGDLCQGKVKRSW